MTYDQNLQTDHHDPLREIIKSDLKMVWMGYNRKEEA